MSQSSTIAFFLLGGFIVYITIKGELPSYAGVLGIGPKATPITIGPNLTTVTSGPTTNPDTLGGAFSSLSSLGSGSY